MKLRRKWARVCTVLHVGVVVFPLCYFPLRNILRTDSLAVPIVCIALHILCYLASEEIQWRYLRCDACRRGTAPVRWSPGKRHCCPNCGEPFVFDDEWELPTKKS